MIYWCSWSWYHITCFVPYSCWQKNFSRIFFYFFLNYCILYVKLIGYQFWCTICAFRLMKCLQWCSGWKRWKSENLWKTIEDKRKNPNHNAMKLSQIGQKIELCIRVSKWIYKISFFPHSSNHIRVLGKYRNTWLLGCRDVRGLTTHQQGLRPRGLNVKQIRYQFCMYWISF
jgi:hypothetical protein